MKTRREGPARETRRSEEICGFGSGPRARVRIDGCGRDRAHGCAGGMPDDTRRDAEVATSKEKTEGRRQAPLRSENAMPAAWADYGEACRGAGERLHLQQKRTPMLPDRVSWGVAAALGFFA